MNCPHPSIRTLPACLATLLLVALVTAAPSSAVPDHWSPMSGLRPADGVTTVDDVVTAGGTMYAATDAGVRASSGAASPFAPFGGLTAATRALATTDSSGLVAGTGGGVFASGGGAFVQVGAATAPGAVTAVGRSGSVLLAAPATGGLLRSVDGGATWAALTPATGVPGGTAVAAITSTTASTVLAATNVGVLRSDDGGATWTVTSDGITGAVRDVLQHPNRPAALYAVSDQGAFRSQDGGSTWQGFDAGLDTIDLRDLEMLPNSTFAKLYAATDDGMFAVTVRADGSDVGSTWQEATRDGLFPNYALRSVSPPTFNDSGNAAVVVGTDNAGGYEMGLTPVGSAASEDNPTASAPSPTMIGTAVQGGTLTAVDGTWTGTAPRRFSYQWDRCTSLSGTSCTPIEGQTRKTFVIPHDRNSNSADDLRYRVRVTGSNVAPTFDVQTRPARPSAFAGENAGTPPGEGSIGVPTPHVLAPGSEVDPAVGDSLQVDDWTLSVATTSRTYTWLRCDASGDDCVDIPDTNARTYVLRMQDAGARLRVRMLAANAAGSVESTTPKTLVAVTESAPRLADPEPTLSGSTLQGPSLAGRAVVDDLLIARTGRWNPDGVTYRTQWQRCGADGSACADIAGAVGATYRVATSDVGARLRAVVSADVNGFDQAPAPTSAATSLSDVIAAAPVPPAPPAPPSPPSPPAADRTKPVLQALTLAPKRVVRGRPVVLGYRLSEQARFTVVIQRAVAGRRVGARCVPGRRVGTRCVVYRTAATTAVALRTRLTGSVPVATVVRRRALVAGAYRLLVTPIDSAGNLGATKAVAFAITNPPRRR